MNILSKRKINGKTQVLHDIVIQVAQVIIFLLMQETSVQTLAWEHALEEEMATHFSILAWKIDRLHSLGSHTVL